jgi:hypothetical protein
MDSIEGARDEVGASEFWRKVHLYHAGLSAEDRRAHLADQTLGDDLADPGDDVLTAEGAW